MSLVDAYTGALGLCIEMAGGVVIAFGCARGVLELARHIGAADATRRCQLIVADAVLAGLGFKVAATLLHTIELHSWTQIAAFTAILALRTFLKTVVGRERAHLLQSRTALASAMRQP